MKEKEVFERVRKYIFESVYLLELEGRDYNLLTAYAMSTHVGYYIQHVANLQILGTRGTGKTLILRTLAKIVRNPVLLNDQGVSPTAAEQIIQGSRFPVTILLDDIAPDSALMSLFSTYYGVPIIYATTHEFEGKELKKHHAHSCFVLRLPALFEISEQNESTGLADEAMPKMTTKYSSALTTLRRLLLPTDGDQETNYGRLTRAGYWWDSKASAWLKLDNEPSDPASPIIRIRVWAEAYKVEGVASQVVSAMTGKGYALLEQSQAYTCRPPKQAESRVYLSFIKEQS